MPILCIHLLQQVLTITEEELKSMSGLQSSPATLERMVEDLQLLVESQSPAEMLPPASPPDAGQTCKNRCLTSSSPKPQDEIQIDKACTSGISKLLSTNDFNLQIASGLQDTQ